MRESDFLSDSSAKYIKKLNEFDLDSGHPFLTPFNPWKCVLLSASNVHYRRMLPLGIMIRRASDALYLEAKALHAVFVFLNGGKAVLGGVGSVGEQHAFVALGFFFLADAAGLWTGQISSRSRTGRQGLKGCAPWASPAGWLPARRRGC